MQVENPLVEAVRGLVVALAAAADEAEAFRKTAEAAMCAVGAGGATVYLHDPQTKRLYFAQAIGRQGDAPAAVPALGLASEEIADDEGIAGAAFQSREPQIVNHVASDPRHADQMDEKISFRTRSVAAVALGLPGGAPYGVLQAINKRGAVFTEEDATTLLVLGEVLGLALALRRAAPPA